MLLSIVALYHPPSPWSPSSPSSPLLHSLSPSPPAAGVIKLRQVCNMSAAHLSRLESLIIGLLGDDVREVQDCARSAMGLIIAAAVRGASLQTIISNQRDRAVFSLPNGLR
jgi:hypothetical protein